MSFNSLLVETADIQVNTPTYADSGQQEDSWSNVASNQPCRVENRTGGIDDTGQFKFSQGSHVIFLRPISGVTIDPENHRAVVSGTNYKILFANRVKDSKDVHHIELSCEVI